MRPSSATILGIPTRRMLRLTAAAILTAAVTTYSIMWLIDRWGKPPFWRLCLAILIALESAYLAAVACVVVGIPLLTVLALRGRRRGVHRPLVGRLLLAISSLSVCGVLAESISSAWLARTAGTSAVPVGGQGPWIDRQAMWPPLTGEDVALPESFPDPPGDSDIDLVVVGESSAEGVPYSDWLSIGRLVAWKLWEAIPHRRLQLQVLARSGDTLELQHQRLRNLTRRPDLMIIYCGHNEFCSRLAGSRDLVHYLDEQAPGAWRLAREQLESISPFCGLVRRTADKCELGIAAPPARRKLIDTPAYKPVEYVLLLADFRRRLEAIVSYVRRVGAVVVLIIPAGNDTGFEPNRSFLPATLKRTHREAFERAVLAARRLEETDPAAAVGAYRALIDRQPGYAETHYRLGVLLDRAGDSEGAYRQFIAARDHDGYPVRCLTAFQDIYRDVAARHDVILVDTQAELHAVGRRGLLDDELFQDAMHPSLRGQIALAQAVLRGLRARRAFGWPERLPAPTIDPAECLIRFAVRREAWKTICLWGIHFGGYVQGLRYESALRFQKKKAYADAYERLQAGAAPDALGLPNVGAPEPVPAVIDSELSRMTRSTSP
jgi:lysophospholipase L1-like esterase